MTLRPPVTRPDLTRDDLVQRDAEDPLADLRLRFQLPEDVLYFDGNSLGPLTHLASERLRQVEGQWRRDLVASWNRHDWIDLPRRVGSKLAPLLGADPESLVVCDSVSVNLFKLMAAGRRYVADREPARRRIAAQAGHFPTDLYLADGLAEMLGDAGGVRRLSDADLDRLLVDPGAVLDPEIAVVSLGHVDFRTGRLYDMPALTRAIHQAGALALWDLSHSAGALPIDLRGSGVDLAVGCGYKYLNGGPGAPSFLYVAPALLPHLNTPLPGWLGHADPFAFAPRYLPAEGIQRFVCGTPPILSLQALDAALDVFADVDLQALRVKSLALGDAFLQLADQRLSDLGVVAASPSGTQRGSHVSLRHPEAQAAMQALIERGIVGDFRAPDLLRFGLSPLFQRHVEVWDAVEALREILTSGRHRRQRVESQGKVT